MEVVALLASCVEGIQGFEAVMSLLSSVAMVIAMWIATGRGIDCAYFPSGRSATFLVGAHFNWYAAISSDGSC